MGRHFQFANSCMVLAGRQSEGLNLQHPLCVGVLLCDREQL